jgi:hypothetical protein
MDEITNNQPAGSHTPGLGPLHDGQGNLKVTCRHGCGRLIWQGEHDGGCPPDPQLSPQHKSY